MEDILKEINEQETRLVAVKASREVALAHLNESNEAAQKISKERRAIQAQIDHLPIEFPKQIEILAEIKATVEGEINKKLFEEHLKTFQ